MLRCPDMPNIQDAPDGDDMNLFDALEQEIDYEAAEDIWFTEQEVRAIEEPDE